MYRSDPAHKLSTFSSTSYESLLDALKHRAGLPSQSLGLSHLDFPQCITVELAIHLLGQLCHSLYRIKESSLRAGFQVYISFPQFFISLKSQSSVPQIILYLSKEFWYFRSYFKPGGWHTDQYFSLLITLGSTSLTWLILVWVQNSHLAVILENILLFLAFLKFSFMYHP